MQPPLLCNCVVQALVKGRRQRSAQGPADGSDPSRQREHDAGRRRRRRRGGGRPALALPAWAPSLPGAAPCVHATPAASQDVHQDNMSHAGGRGKGSHTASKCDRATAFGPCRSVCPHTLPQPLGGVDKQRRQDGREGAADQQDVSGPADAKKAQGPPRRRCECGAAPLCVGSLPLQGGCRRRRRPRPPCCNLPHHTSLAAGLAALLQPPLSGPVPTPVWAFNAARCTGTLAVPTCRAKMPGHARPLPAAAARRWRAGAAGGEAQERLLWQAAEPLVDHVSVRTCSSCCVGCSVADANVHPAPLCRWRVQCAPSRRDGSACLLWV